MKQRGKYILYTAVTACIAFILTNAADVIRCGRDAIEMCLTYIIPSLFPFFVCSGLLIYSGFGSVTARVCRPFMKPLFNVSPLGAAAFALGIVSGFPLGAVTAVQLYECHAVSKTEAERLLAFCGNSGPLFIIGTIGASVYGKPSYGVLLYVIHIISSLLVGIVFRNYKKDKHTAPPHSLITADTTAAKAFSSAMSGAVKSMINVCFSIIFFYAVSRAILDKFSLPPVLDSLASGICEFSSGSIKAAALDLDLCKKLVLTSFIVGVSGIGVFFQVTSAVSDTGLSVAPYAAGKLLHGTFAAALTLLAMRLIPINVTVFSQNAAPMSAAYLSSLSFAGAALAAASLTGAIIALASHAIKNKRPTAYGQSPV